MLKKNTVLLLKSQQEDIESDNYRTSLMENGFNVKHCEPLSYYFENMDELEEKLKNPDKYEGIIFISRRCVQAVHLVQYSKLFLRRWLSKHNFVVGEAIYKDALDKLRLCCEGKEAGDTLQLSQLILASQSEYQKSVFLVPHGDMNINSLSRELGQFGITAECVLVYDAILNEDFKRNIKDITNNYQDTPEYIVVFSSSGLLCSLHLLKRLSNFEMVKFIAIDPTTELTMKEQGLQVYGVLKKPTPNDLLNILLK